MIFSRNDLTQDTQPGVHEPLGVHLPISRGTFIAQPQQINFYTSKWVHLSCSENIHMFYFNSFSLCAIRNFRGKCSSGEMIKGTWSGKGWEPLI